MYWWFASMATLNNICQWHLSIFLFSCILFFNYGQNIQVDWLTQFGLYDDGWNLKYFVVYRMEY